jgi:hypothetical protein
LDGGIVEGNLNIFGLPAERFDLYVIIGLKAKELFAD